jgi:hypothetical protein
VGQLARRGLPIAGGTEHAMQDHDGRIAFAPEIPVKQR